MVSFFDLDASVSFFSSSMLTGGALFTILKKRKIMFRREKFIKSEKNLTWQNACECDGGPWPQSGSY